MLERIYFAINVMNVSGLEPKMQPFIEFGSHIGGHLGFILNAARLHRVTTDEKRLLLKPSH